jgi:hypothetical protein
LETAIMRRRPEDARRRLTGIWLAAIRLACRSRGSDAVFMTAYAEAFEIVLNPPPRRNRVLN